ncbi:MAG TPA: PilZ domain-containing protein [Terriglobales bacterium]|nr:PilZ domain-containing protein [Terriglobales bacterium]
MTSYESALIPKGMFFILNAMRPDLPSVQTRFGKSAERQAPRFKVDFAIRVITGPATGVSTFQGRAHDLSERGLSMYAPAEFEEGQQVHLEFIPPFSRKCLRLLAIVRSRSGNRYGLELRNVHHDAAEELSRACRTLSLTAQ